MRRANRILLMAGMFALSTNGIHASIFRHGKTEKPSPAPVAVAAMSLTAVDVDSSRILLRTSGNPAYTSYSPAPDVFVVDLTGTTKDTGLTLPASFPAGVASVAAEEVTEMGNRLTRVTFRLSAPAALKASADGTVVTVAVPAPVASDAPAVAIVADVRPAEPRPSIADLAPLEAPHAEPIADAQKVAVAEPVATSEPLPAATEVPSAPLANAKNLKRIETTGTGSSIEVALAGDGAIAYKAFRLDNPARLVLDLTGVKNTIARTNITVADSLVKRIRVAQFKSAPDAVTRVVLDLDSKSDYRVRRDGERLLVSFGSGTAVVSNAVSNTVSNMPSATVSSAPPAVTMAATVPRATSPAPAASTMTVIEPVKVADKPARKQDKLRKPAAAPQSADIPAQVPTIAESATARASDSATWKMPETASSGARAVINAPQDQTTAPTTPSRSRARRSTNTSTPARTAPAAGGAAENVFNDPAVPGTATSTSQTLSGGSQLSGRQLSPGERIYTGEPISLNLKDADIKDVLRTFAQLTGLNVAVDPQVQGTVTVDFTDVPWDQALDIILRQNGLTWVLEGNVMRVGTVERIANETAQARRLADEERLNVQLQTVGFKLSYARAAEVQSLIKELASPRARIIVDARTNQLIISDIPQYLQLVRNLIDSIDVPTRQVVIEARIVETTKSFTQQYGFDWGFTGAFDPALGNGTGLVFPNRIGYTGGPFKFGPGNPIISTHLSDVLGTFNLDLALNALESETLARVIGAPKVMTQDNTAAEIQSGLQIPYQTRVNFTTTVQYIDATLRLSVTPQITEAGTVIMDIAVQKTTPGNALEGAAGPSLNTRQARTRLMVRDGATAVIGGIYQVSDNSSESRVPLLHEIPVIGNLFKSHSINTTHDELLIFITPRIVRNS